MGKSTVSQGAERVERPKRREKILIKKVQGDSLAYPKDNATYEVKQYNVDNSEVTEDDKRKIKWVVWIDGRIEYLHQRGEKITINIKESWIGKEIFVSAYCISPVKSISQKTDIKHNKEHIIIIGTQQHNGDWKKNVLRMDVGANSKFIFVHQALRKVIKNKDIPWTILFCTEGYSDNQKNKIKEVFESATENETTHTFISINKVSDIINHLNNGNADIIREKVKVYRLLIYSHGIVKEILPWMGAWAKGDSLNVDKVMTLDTNAFLRNTFIYSFACRTGLGNSKIDKSIYVNGKSGECYNLLSTESLAQKMANATNSIVYAYLKRTWYGDSLFTSDEYDFMDAYESYRQQKKPERESSSYKHILEIGPNEGENERYISLSKIRQNRKTVDGAVFDPNGALHPVRAAETPKGLPEDMKTYKKI